MALLTPKCHGCKLTPHGRQVTAHAGRCIYQAPRRRAVAANAVDLVAPLAELAEGGVPSAALLVGPLLAGGIGVAALRFYCYSQMEYITAAMLTNHVPRGGSGAQVVQLGGGPKELYYYPKDTMEVINVGPDVNRSLMEQAGMTAAVPTKARKQSPDDLSFLPDASVDAVVSLETLGRLNPSQRSKCLSEIQRVLKPGKPLIFVERLQEGGSPLRALIGGSNGALGVQEVESWGQFKGLEGLQWDTALGGQDPHAAGVAFRKEGYVLPRSQREDASRQKVKQPKPQKTAKGFS